MYSDDFSPPEFSVINLNTGSEERRVSEASTLSAEEAERRALAAAVIAARTDPRPDVPHETVREVIKREIEELEQKVAALPAA